MSAMGEVWPERPGIEDVRITAEGAVLTGRLFRPAGRPVAVAVLHGATGVPMGFYRAFAEWLSTVRNVAVLTYDYRDFGASARGPVRKARATMADWGLKDQPAALAAAAVLVPGVPRWVIGHSLGGVMLAFHPGMAGVERTILVASGPVHVTDHLAGFGLLARLFWHGMAPVAHVAGYLPGWLGLGVDLPLGVYLDWRRWCTTKGFHLAEVGRRLPLPDQGAVRGEMRVVAVADDNWVPPAAVWRGMAMYPQAVKRQVVLRPGDFALPGIGHLGALARRNAAVWPALVD
jgi:predicted alpha/beta hydrolase